MPSPDAIGPGTTRPRGTRGFTLIEVLAAILLTAIVIGFAVNFFFDLNHATNVATERTRTTRHSVALLDRLARDLESAFLLTKPAETDPLDHPWMFVAEGPLGEGGADRVRFISRNHRRRTNQGHDSDFATVTVILREGDGGYELVRMEEPGMPYQLARGFPSEDDESMVVMGERIESFAMRFLSEDGEWAESWDSTQLLESSALPLAVELEVSLLEGDETLEEDDFGSFGELDDEPSGDLFTRRVLLPFRPIDLAALEAGGQTDERDCVTVSQCINEVARQPCNAIWRDRCEQVAEENAPDTCIEDAENVPDGLIDWCVKGEGEPDEPLEGDDEAAVTGEEPVQ